MQESSPADKTIRAAVALWMMAGPPPPRHGNEQAFETPLQPMTLCLRSGTFKTDTPPSIRS